jgi:hypothetical protein
LNLVCPNVVLIIVMQIKNAIFLIALFLSIYHRSLAAYLTAKLSLTAEPTWEAV